jgi:hypothetical protein
MGNVNLVGFGLTSACFYFTCRLGGQFGIQVCDHYPGPLSGQGLTGGPPNPRSSAHYQRHLSIQSKHICVVHIYPAYSL